MWLLMHFYICFLCNSLWDKRLGGEEGKWITVPYLPVVIKFNWGIFITVEWCDVQTMEGMEKLLITSKCLSSTVLGAVLFCAKNQKPFWTCMTLYGCSRELRTSPEKQAEVLAELDWNCWIIFTASRCVCWLLCFLTFQFESFQSFKVQKQCPVSRTDYLHVQNTMYLFKMIYCDPVTLHG